MSESKKKDRLYLVIFVKFQDGKQLNARVQCKMYSLKDKNHVMWGACLKSLQIDCRVRDGQSHVDVQQVLFKQNGMEAISLKFTHLLCVEMQRFYQTSLNIVFIDSQGAQQPNKCSHSSFPLQRAISIGSQLPLWLFYQPISFQ